MIQGTPAEQETRCHVPGAAGALDGHMDTGTLREPERRSSTRPTVGGDAVSQERRRKVQSVRVAGRTFAPESQAAKEVMAFVRPSGGLEATEQGTKSKESKLDRSRTLDRWLRRNPRMEGTQQQYSSTVLLHAVLTSSTFSAT